MKRYICCAVLALLCLSVHAQYMQVVPALPGRDSLNTFCIQKYLVRQKQTFQKLATRQQRESRKVLAKLSHKEQRLYKQLGAKDSLLKSQLQQSVDFDSLRKTKTVGKFYRSGISAVDSLKRIAAFAQRRGMNIPDKDKLAMPDELNQIQQQLDYNAYLQKQIQTRKQQLLQSAAHIAGINKGLLTRIEKDAYYYNAKLKSWKAIANDPDALETKALDLLKGMKGFEESMSGRNSTASRMGGTGPGGNPNAVNDLSRSYGMQDVKPEDLEKMGFQTRKQVTKSIDNKFGLSQNADALKGVNDKLQQGQQQIAQYKTGVSNIKSQVTGLRNTEKPSFRVNPMRGVPLRMRIERGLNWSVLPSGNGKPATLDLSAKIGFKHTPRLTYALGVGGAVGLGANWYNMRLSYEGVSATASLDYKCIWGISAQAGYSRVYKNYTKSYVSSSTSELPGQVINQTLHYRDLAYMGIMKIYKASKTLNGTMLIAYNFLHPVQTGQANGVGSPFIVQLGLKK